MRTEEEKKLLKREQNRRAYEKKKGKMSSKIEELPDDSPLKVGETLINEITVHSAFSVQDPKPTEPDAIKTETVAEENEDVVTEEELEEYITAMARQQLEAEKAKELEAMKEKESEAQPNFFFTILKEMTMKTGRIFAEKMAITLGTMAVGYMAQKMIQNQNQNTHSSTVTRETSAVNSESTLSRPVFIIEQTDYYPNSQ